MNKELEAKLVKEFPTIFKDIYGDPKKTCMAWGCACGDGWFDIIRDTCLHWEFIGKKAGIQIVATQIKEKFGTLRFYHTLANDQECKNLLTEDDKNGWWHLIMAIDNLAHYRSSITCEDCGSGDFVETKSTVPGRWIKTLCETCRAKTEHSEQARIDKALKMLDETQKHLEDKEKNICCGTPPQLPPMRDPPPLELIRDGTEHPSIYKPGLLRKLLRRLCQDDIMD